MRNKEMAMMSASTQFLGALIILIAAFYALFLLALMGIIAGDVFVAAGAFGLGWLARGLPARR